MKTPIFDERAARLLYQRYWDGDETALEEFVECSQSLIEVFASELVHPHSMLWDDLVIEGQIRVYEICREMKYDPDSKSKLHSFLSVVIKNKMIDYLRRENKRSFISLDELDIPLTTELQVHGYVPHNSIFLNGASDQEIKGWQQECVEYAVKRFPSLHESVSADASQYVLDAIIEIGGNFYKSPTTTLTTIFTINRAQARTILEATTILFRGLLIHKPMHVEDALTAVTNDLEWTNFPEIVLTAGKDAGRDLRFLCQGLYIKFPTL